MRCFQRILCLLVVCATVSPAADDMWQQWFERANGLYQRHAYDSALDVYSDILHNGGTHSAVYYNIANCYYRMDSLGRAIQYYEKALLRAPRDEDIRTNLEIARQKIVNKAPTPEYGFFEQAMVAFHEMVALRTQLWIIFGLLCVAGLLVWLALFGSYSLRLWCMYVAFVVGIVLAATAASAGRKIYVRERITHGVVLSTSVDAMNQPEGRKVLFTVHEGITVRMRKTQQEWVLISLPNGMSGWVRREDLGRI